LYYHQTPKLLVVFYASSKQLETDIKLSLTSLCVEKFCGMKFSENRDLGSHVWYLNVFLIFL